MTDLEAMKILICRGRICNDCNIKFHGRYRPPCHVLNEVDGELRRFAYYLKQNPVFLSRQIKNNPGAWKQVRKYFSATLK